MWDLACRPQFANQCSRCSIFSPDLSEGLFRLFFYLLQNVKAISTYTLPPILLNEGQLAQQAKHQAGGGEGQRERIPEDWCLWEGVMHVELRTKAEGGSVG